MSSDTEEQEYSLYSNFQSHTCPVKPKYLIFLLEGGGAMAGLRERRRVREQGGEVTLWKSRDSPSRPR